MAFFGYSFIGKNIINILPIIAGGFLYSKYKKINFSKILPAIVFSCCLTPVINFIYLQTNLIKPLNIIFVILIGIFIGFIIYSLSLIISKLHKGFTMYNIGLAAGLLAIVLFKIFLFLDYKPYSQSIISSNYHNIIELGLIIYFLFLIFTGFLLNGKSFNKYKETLNIYAHKYTSFIEDFNYGLAFIHLGFTGLLFIIFVEIFGGVFNGPTIAAILFATGFSLSGKNIFNIFPILTATFLITRLNYFDTNSAGLLMSAILSTALVPIASVFGNIPAFIAALVHMVIGPF